MRHFFFMSLLFYCSVTVAAALSEHLSTYSFKVAPGDSLIVENDFGRVKIKGWNEDRVEITARAVAADRAHLDNVNVVAQKAGDKIFVNCFFYRYSSESVDLEIKAPAGLNAVVWGANPTIEVGSLQGFVRVQTLTGLITAHDLQSSSSLFSESGDISYQAGRQPKGDIRLETVSGSVHCRLDSALNLRAVLRAGGTLTWNHDLSLSAGALDKDVGKGGPLLYAASMKGNVQFRLQQDLARSAPGPATPGASVPDHFPRPVSTSRGTNGSSTAHRSASTRDPILRDPVPANGRSDRRAAAERSTASGAGDEPLQSGTSFKVDVDWVYLNVSVRDRNTNRSIPNLRKKDFQIFEDGVEQVVEKLTSTEAPFNLLLLLDVSGSTRSYIDLIRRASIDFTREIKRNDRIAVAVFNSDVELIQPFSNDRPQVERAINSIRSGGGTAFYDALYTSVQRYMRSVEGRKAIVVFTDGVDNQLTGDTVHGSRIPFPQLFRTIQETDSIIYTIFLDTEGRTPLGSPRGRGGTVIDILGDIIYGRRPPTPTRRPTGYPNRRVYAEAQHQLQAIADQTGGRMYSPRRIDDLSRVYSEIADDLRIQYTLAYSSSNPSKEGKWRKVRVVVPGNPGWAVRTRRGYYASAAGTPASP